MTSVLLIAAALLGSSLAAHAAQDYPNKPIRLVVPYPPGGANDSIARPFVQKMSERLGVQVILDNRGGAGAMIGTELVAKAPPDGYTILFCSTATHATSPQLFKKVPYDPFRDFEPVVLLATTPVLAASNNLNGITSIKGLVDAAKAAPGKLTYGSGGVGSVSHLSAEMFKSLAKIDILHVPYKGGGDFQGDMIAGRIDIQINSAPTVSPHVKSGRMTAIGIARSARWPELPNVQTFAEAGWPQFKAGGWYGLCAPAKTPRTVIDRLQRETVAVAQSADFRARLTALIADPAGSTPMEFAAHLRSEYDRYGKVIKETGARAE